MNGSACTKRPYLSERAAKLAHQRTGARIRVYWCFPCGAYHVTNVDKHRGGSDPTVEIPRRRVRA